MSVGRTFSASMTLEQVQQRLNELGYDCGPVDGRMGSRTKAAIERFQADRGLKKDGNPGPETQGALQAGLAPSKGGKPSSTIDFATGQEIVVRLTRSCADDKLAIKRGEATVALGSEGQAATPPPAVMAVVAGKSGGKATLDVSFARGRKGKPGDEPRFEPRERRIATARRPTPPGTRSALGKRPENPHLPGTGEFNQAVLDVIVSYPTDGKHGYWWPKEGGWLGTTRDLKYGGKTIAVGDPLGRCYCSGITFEAFFRAWEAWSGQDSDSLRIGNMDVPAINRFRKLWYGADSSAGKEAQRKTLQYALTSMDLGSVVGDLNDAKPGDFVQLWRANGGGHSAVFLSWVREAGGSISRIRYWSSQGSTNGIGVKEESVGPKAVLPEEIYIVRVGGAAGDGGQSEPDTTVKAVQKFLFKGTYDDDSITGLLDEKTREAIRDYQAEKVLDVTGELDDLTITDMEGDGLVVEQSQEAVQAKESTQVIRLVSLSRKSNETHEATLTGPAIEEARFLENLWPAWVKPCRYLVHSPYCQDPRCAGVAILVYPDWFWKVGFEFGYKRETGEPQSKKQKKGTDAGSFKFKGSLKRTVNGNTAEVSAEIEHDLEKAIEVLEKATAIVGLVNEILKKFNCSIEPVWPLLKVSGEWGWKETKKPPGTDFCYDFSIEFAPLLGLTLKVDITVVLINILATAIASPAAAKLLTAAKEEVEKHGGKAKVELSIGAKLGGKLKFKKEPDGQGSEVTGEVEGAFPLQLEGVIEGELSLLIVKVGAGVKVGAKSEVSVTLIGGGDAEGIFVTSEGKFDGLKLYGVAYYSTEKQIAAPPPVPSGTLDAEVEVSANTTLKYEEERSADKVKRSGEIEVTLIKERDLWEKGQKIYPFRRPPAPVGGT